MMNYIRGILDNWKHEVYAPEKSGCHRDFIDQFKKHRTLAFNNFEPRSYDFDKLEKRILGWEE